MASARRIRRRIGKLRAELDKAECALSEIPIAARNHHPVTRLILLGLGVACAIMATNMLFRPAAAVKGKVSTAAWARYGHDNPLLDCYTVWAGFFFLCLSVTILLARNMPRMACADLFTVMAVLWVFDGVWVKWICFGGATHGGSAIFHFFPGVGAGCIDVAIGLWFCWERVMIGVDAHVGRAVVATK